MASCTSCGSYIPDDQGSKSCSMCYGDPYHGKDGYYQDWLEQQYIEEQKKHEPKPPNGESDEGK